MFILREQCCVLITSVSGSLLNLLVFQAEITLLVSIQALPFSFISS